jgi:hypothetical protein
MRTVIERMSWMRAEGIWPNGQRYLWTDAFGVVLYVSLYKRTGDDTYLERAQWLVGEVERVLGRERGLRIGEAADRDGQYYHYLAMWIFALSRLGRIIPGYRERAVELAKEIHRPFTLPNRGVWWKMKEDLSGPYPGFGYGALDPYEGYAVYTLLEEPSLAIEIAEMRRLIESSYRDLDVVQDLGCGMLLWLTHMFPQEEWAKLQRRRCLATLEHLWLEDEDCFCRSPDERETKIAFTNYGIALGLQSVGEQPSRVSRLKQHFETHGAGNGYAREAITHVMACVADLPGDFLLYKESPMVGSARIHRRFIESQAKPCT